MSSALTKLTDEETAQLYGYCMGKPEMYSLLRRLVTYGVQEDPDTCDVVPSKEQSVQRFSGWGIAMMQNKPTTEYVLASDYDALAAQMRTAPSILLARAVELLQLGASSDERSRLRKDIEAFLRSPRETLAPRFKVGDKVMLDGGCAERTVLEVFAPITRYRVTMAHCDEESIVLDERSIVGLSEKSSREPALTINKPPQNITASASTDDTASPARLPPSSVECPKCEKHGVELNDESDECWECAREADPNAPINS